ncbi:hypothetical protein D3C83_324580 [compost metagenome]
MQKAYDRIEARFVTGRSLTEGEEDRLRRQLLFRLPEGFRVDIVYCESIARSEGGKFEDFISEVGPRS